MTTVKEARDRIIRPDIYGLLTLDEHGEVKKYSWIESHYLYRQNLKKGMSATDYFVWLGWNYVEGAGFYDKDGNLAEAYYNGNFVNYPAWHS